MRNLGKQLAVLTLAAGSFGLTQATLAGERITVIHSTGHHAPYATLRHHYPQSSFPDCVWRAQPHGYAHTSCACRDYRYRPGHTPDRYDGHHHGDNKSGSRWHSDRRAGTQGHVDHEGRSPTYTAYAKGYRD
jgi:hypothetical protein